MAPKNSHGVTNLRATGFCLRRLARVIVSAGSLPLQPCRHSMQQRLCSLFWALELHFAKVSCCSLSGRIERQGKGRDMRGKRSPLPLRCLLLLGEKQGFQHNWNCYSLSAARLPSSTPTSLRISPENPYVKKAHTLNEPPYTILLTSASFLSDYNSIQYISEIIL